MFFIYFNVYEWERGYYGCVYNIFENVDDVIKGLVKNIIMFNWYLCVFNKDEIKLMLFCELKKKF